MLGPHNRLGPNARLAPNARLGLYVHWPFCRAKCPYCDFNSHVSRDVDNAAFARAFRREMQHLADLYSAGREVSSIFFGGGTPSLMPPWLLDGILQDAEDIFGFSDGIEITAEANPTSTEAENLSAFKSAGVNRVSLGVQSMSDADLSFLGREHSVREALQAVEVARQLFDRVSIDLIYALHGQTAQRWEKELTSALQLGLDHMSLYQLTIESGTAFFARNNAGEILTVDDDLAADLYLLTDDIMTAAKMPAYEVSNYARPGSECQHNLIYWRAEDWIGIGPGAHSRITKTGARGRERHGLATRRNPSSWLADIEKNGHGIDITTQDTLADCVAERLMMGLRLSEGIDLGVFESQFGALNRHIDPASIQNFCQMGLLTQTPDRLAATRDGRLVLNRILADLLTDSASK